MPSDLSDAQWDLLEPVFDAPGKRGRTHAHDLRRVVEAILYIAQRATARRQSTRSVSETTIPSGPRTWAIRQVFSC